MKPLEVAARFAAFVWYTNYGPAPSRTTRAEARQFSQENWQAFLPVLNEGWGRLLLRIAKARPNVQRLPAAVSRCRKRRLAAAV
jgi:hypothetical protein